MVKRILCLGLAGIINCTPLSTLSFWVSLFPRMCGYNILTSVQVSQEAGQVVWYSHLFKNFPQFFVIHTVKGFSIVDEADVFLEFPCFFYDPMDVVNLISGSSAFSKSSLYIWKLLVHILLKPSWKILNITLLACEMSAIVTKCGYQLFCPLELREGHGGWRLAYKKCSAKWPPCLGATHDHTQKREFHSVQYWREEILEPILEVGFYNM